MRYAIIENNFIVNVIVADKEFVEENYPTAILCPDTYGVGDKYINETFISESLIIPNQEVSE